MLCLSPTSPASDFPLGVLQSSPVRLKGDTDRDVAGKPSVCVSVCLAAGVSSPGNRSVRSTQGDSDRLPDGKPSSSVVIPIVSSELSHRVYHPLVFVSCTFHVSTSRSLPAIASPIPSGWVYVCTVKL
ncbi:hypothetical protein NP493_38g02026 [Ridgeia piscesae]|uniref:Uncharacterized protein n=1 Tax=Ridgeia piscesae TaxID=27915 RepID=A0AAD9PC56_RIDPI|nr:hypothetical protein NP493_7537g00000 [Ridgeia piscesae]KAK2192104.1 hypothetical protein NP493_38g02026 [Ridgeia piscesae]